MASFSILLSNQITKVSCQKSKWIIEKFSSKPFDDPAFQIEISDNKDLGIKLHELPRKIFLRIRLKKKKERGGRIKGSSQSKIFTYRVRSSKKFPWFSVIVVSFVPDWFYRKARVNVVVSLSFVAAGSERLPRHAQRKAFLYFHDTRLFVDNESPEKVRFLMILYRLLLRFSWTRSWSFVESTWNLFSIRDQHYARFYARYTCCICLTSDFTTITRY